MKVKVSTLAFSKNPYLCESLWKEFPDAVVNKDGIRMLEDELIRYFSDADAVIVGLESITSSLLEALPNLRIIAKYGVGLDNIDLEACRQRNIEIGWVGGVNKRSVAEMALGFMLALLRNLYCTSNQLKQMFWNKDGGIQLSGRTVGIIGVGNIGKELVKLLMPFQCTILVNDTNNIDSFASENNLQKVSKEELIRRSDIISIHTPYTQETANMIDLSVLKTMKPTSFVINTARGGIINETDLKYALLNEIIAGAALDVYEIEPPVDQELLKLPNLICTPHIGGNSYESVVAMGLSAINHLITYRDSIKAEPV